MIEKQRLQELINKDATIYWNDGYMEIPLNKKCFIENDKLYWFKKDFVDDDWFFKLKDLFETEEDAHWELEMTATRTETLKLPKWEYWQKVSKYGMYAMSFFDKENHYCELQILETIKVVKWGYGRTVEFENSATKENYIEACKLCLRLFKGEEV